MGITRRQFIQQTTAITAGMALAPLVYAGGSDTCDKYVEDLSRYDILFPRVKFSSDGRTPDRWNAFPIGDKNLLQAFQRTVRCRTKPMPGLSKNVAHGRDDQFNAVVTFDRLSEVEQFSFLFMTSEGDYGFTDEQKQNLKTYLERGGFIHMDDCAFNAAGDYFYKRSYQILTELFGNNAMQTVPTDHEIFHNVHDLGQTGLPYINGQNYGPRGLFIDGRLAVFLSSTDLHCGWCDSDFTWFGPNGNMPTRSGHAKAIEMGINILMYAMSH